MQISEVSLYICHCIALPYSLTLDDLIFLYVVTLFKKDRVSAKLDVSNTLRDVDSNSPVASVEEDLTSGKSNILSYLCFC